MATGSFMENSGIYQLVFKEDTPVIENELNEAQQIMYDLLKKFFATIYGDALAGASTRTINYDSATSKFTISNDFAVVGGNVLYISTLSITANEGDTIYLKCWSEEKNSTSLIRKYGNAQETNYVANLMVDSRVNAETSTRIGIGYNLATINGAETGYSYAKLGIIYKGVFMQSIPEIQALANYIQRTEFNTYKASIAQQFTDVNTSLTNLSTSLTTAINTAKSAVEKDLWEHEQMTVSSTTVHDLKITYNVDSGLIINTSAVNSEITKLLRIGANLYIDTVTGKLCAYEVDTKGTKYQMFTSNGTFTATSPLVYVTLLGGGGAGGGGRTSSTLSGTGGGSGAYIHNYPIVLPVGSTVDIVVGAGGVCPSVYSNGNDGGQSSFGTYAVAGGGKGGTVGSGVVGVGVTVITPVSGSGDTLPNLAMSFDTLALWQTNAAKYAAANTYFSGGKDGSATDDSYKGGDGGSQWTGTAGYIGYGAGGGTGADGNTDDANPGGNATGFGCGGGGSARGKYNDRGNVGGSGYQGFVLVWWYE